MYILHDGILLFYLNKATAFEYQIFGYLTIWKDVQDMIQVWEEKQNGRSEYLATSKNLLPNKIMAGYPQCKTI